MDTNSDQLPANGDLEAATVKKVRPGYVAVPDHPLVATKNGKFYERLPWIIGDGVKWGVANTPYDTLEECEKSANDNFAFFKDQGQVRMPAPRGAFGRRVEEVILNPREAHIARRLSLLNSKPRAKRAKPEQATALAQP
jgi:hypothetical protein